MNLPDPTQPLTVQEINDLPGVNTHNNKKAALILRALNHRLRQQIITEIHVRQKITVTQLYVHLHLEQSVASQHLAILRRSGIVVTQRDGKHIYYSINAGRVREINEFVRNLIQK